MEDGGRLEELAAEHLVTATHGGMKGKLSQPVEIRGKQERLLRSGGSVTVSC